MTQLNTLKAHELSSIHYSRRKKCYKAVLTLMKSKSLLSRCFQGSQPTAVGRFNLRKIPISFLSFQFHKHNDTYVSPGSYSGD